MQAFLWYMRIGIGQYVILRPLTTLVRASWYFRASRFPNSRTTHTQLAVIGEATNTYCGSSWSPAYFHIWTSAIVSISVTVAMYWLVSLFRRWKGSGKLIVLISSFM